MWQLASEINCKLVIVAFAVQRFDLVELGVAPMVQAHEGIDVLELRVELDKSIGAVEL